MIAFGLLLPAALLVPLLLAACCLSAWFRTRALSLLVVAPLPALAAAVLVPEGRFAFFPAPFRLTLVLDQPGATLLGGAALLWSAAGAYAASLMARDPGAARFAIWWLLTLTGSLGLFIVGDVVNFYLLFTLASLAAYGLIIHEQSAAAHRAGVIYVVLALAAEAFLLIALVMLASAHPDANPQIRSVVADLPASAMRDGTIALFIMGFALKMGLVPLHVWLPLAHPAAPMPASAVLSGVVVKAGVIGLIRFLPFEAGAPFWGHVLIGLGIVTAYYGVLVGVTQRRAKTVLAYSTVSQMGLLAVLLGVGLETADTAATHLAAHYAVHHTLVKGALFLGIGILAATGGRRLRLVLVMTGVLALSLGGLPLTSGALAKLATKPMLGYGWLSGAMSLAGAGSTLLMLHFLLIVRNNDAGNPAASPPLGQLVPWLIVWAASLVIPWSLYPVVSGETIASLLQPEALWKVVWPMLIGGAAFLLIRRMPQRLGAIPEGDIVVLAQAGSPLVDRLSDRVGEIDVHLRRWPMAGLGLIALAILLGGALMLRA
ncbi:Formate hydrogenlyase subunit 3/Multisubunit Na+/H+ antiporter, MnhD subunit [Hyphomicrobiales bacterium]|nr:Formate hydrogenlyase subunit 3/Multisubunit Na+/H+ antiporter, MnhD subunit [Hyphomicrobiales bacterium]CAH1698779.1 Formate hydrogenlyase subunit 3/Multisubunit Na+/H+ antiporter, MnhD subunit [Hyphomicrobiales bacterium]CAI0342426.1 Formate hydrogenlyase subunit 3/Multisubunit Na+/H+ antiporter, MnhD subunit [Hyphomicrobiales bacterium]